MTEQKASVFSMCGMCAVRCPIRVEVKDGKPVWIEGNPYSPGIERSICAKGSAGIAFEYDDERPSSPMLRVGQRGSGEWRAISWEEALDYIAEKLKEISSKYGRRAIALADRGGIFNDLTRSFLKALGSPNYFDHDDSCAQNVNMASKSLFGYGRAELLYDYRNTRHIVLYGRNVFESLQVKEANEILDAMDAGAKLTYIDVRANITASKADNFLMIRPGTDYALNLALIHVILSEKLFDQDFAERWIIGLDALKRFVTPYTPEWAASETGITSGEIVKLARTLGQDRPRVILHGGWMVARYKDSFLSSRSIYILNALLGNIEASGGLIIAKGPQEVGVGPLRSLGETIPEPDDQIIDEYLSDGPLGTGHIVNLYKAIETGKPYPVKAFFAYRYDPIASLPDPEEQKKILDNLDLLVSIDVNYSQTAWFSDLILPESTYLERSNIIATQKGPSPSFIMRRQAIQPRFDSKPAWEIFSLIAKKMGHEGSFPYNSIEDIWKYQLEGTGVSIEDFEEKGFASLVSKPSIYDPEKLIFRTSSEKIEFTSPGTFSETPLLPYVGPASPEPGQFRLLFGRSAVHAHAQSQNNILLHELVPENDLWINDSVAEGLGIEDGNMVEVSAAGYSGQIRARVTPYIHPEAVFMLHGFGNEIPLKTRSYKKGLSDTRLATGGLYTIDRLGGGVAHLENMVHVRKPSENASK